MITTSSEPIRADWKVSDVLGRYPQLLDVLIDASPAFRHLGNPLARALRTRLVSVAQAARMAGLQPGELVDTLNAAIGLQSDDQGVPAVTVAVGVSPDIRVDAPIAEELDVRPLLARGEEPFSTIMASVTRVPAHAALRLRTTFEPVPLYDVLGRRGFEYQARQLGPDDWEVTFRRSETPTAHSSSAIRQSAPTPAGTSPMTNVDSEVVCLDVSDLAPPEPMVRILEAAAKLGPHQTLLVEHHRRPVYLYPQLDAQGFVHETRELGPGRVEILIHRGEETPT